MLPVCGIQFNIDGERSFPRRTCRTVQATATVSLTPAAAHGTASLVWCEMGRGVDRGRLFWAAVGSKRARGLRRMRSSQGNYGSADRWRLIVSGPPGAFHLSTARPPTQLYRLAADMATNTTRHTGPRLHRLVCEWASGGLAPSQVEQGVNLSIVVRRASLYDPVQLPAPLPVTPNL